MIYWNCRGLTNVNKLTHIRDLIKVNNLVIVYLIETRADEDRAKNFCSKLKCSGNWVALPSLGFLGGITVLWKSSVGLITPIAASWFSVHLVISSTLP